MTVSVKLDNNLQLSPSTVSKPMDDTSTPRKRKDRRAASRKIGIPAKTYTPNIPLAQPDRSGPKGKTLFDLAEERQALLDAGKPFEKRTDDPSGSSTEEDFGPVGDALLYTLSLSMLHFTLDVIVHHQYRESISWSEIVTRMLAAMPVLFVVVYIMHTETANRFQVVRQGVFLGTAIAAGCYMVYSANVHGYYAVMKRAPPIGTLWVWGVVELKLPWALVSLGTVGGYLWWGGYEAF
ncbi:hypothetical protein M501DRAFT_1005017 [Patellaria atrata CBS 101060]|uniref:DUF7719 domain-containing protein n=1 Tax=Patellaria atrata CBS 101060 TaxID=1346257 RepID=A0A9P4VS41_9PEZI|nr:hypothetical protein M501DRAFT_1005017 [Patellaria atrata CBS 101060]